MKWIRNLTKKIRQAHCDHDWLQGIVEYETKVPFRERELVGFDDLGECKGMRKRCKICSKYENDEEVQVFGQIVGYVK